MWLRLAGIAIVGGLVVAVALTFLALRPAHARASKAARTTPVAVSCPTTRFCMVVDDEGNAITFDDGAWSRPRSIEDTGLTSVSCATPTFCVALGVNGTASVYRGSTWSSALSIDPKSADEVDGFGTSSVNTVSCASTSFCMAGDVLGRVVRFNGATWTRPRPVEAAAPARRDRRAGTAGIAGVSCVAPRFCAAVTVGGRALTFDGTTWSSPVALEPAAVVNADRLRSVAPLGSVACSSPTSCAAVDASGNVYGFDGTTWSGPHAVDPVRLADSDGATALSCPAPGDCVVVDEQGNAVFDTRGTWSGPVVVDPTVGLATVSCGGPALCVALDDLGQAAVYDGHSWTAPKDIDS